MFSVALLNNRQTPDISLLIGACEGSATEAATSVLCARGHVESKNYPQYESSGKDIFANHDEESSAGFSSVPVRRHGLRHEAHRASRAGRPHGRHPFSRCGRQTENTIVVGDDHRRTIPRHADTADDFHDFLAGRMIEGTGRFVANDQFRIVHQCSCDGHPLLLASREARPAKNSPARRVRPPPVPASP